MASRKIQQITAREIIDSRGNPTIEATVILKNGISGKASVPSGASTGIHEALELRDKDKNRYLGMGVRKAVHHVNTEISRLLKGVDVVEQQDIDRLMIKLDDTPNKSRLGANAILAVSLASARTASIATGIDLYKYLRKIYKIHYQDIKMPRPMINILNGGAHANWATDVQEFMIVPKGRTMADMVRTGSEIFHALGGILKTKKFSTNKGDEGGYAADLKKNEDAFVYIQQAIKKAGYKQGHDVDLAIDAASSEFYKAKKYQLNKPKKKLTTTGMISLLAKWQKQYGLISIEDGLAEDDWSGWQTLTKKMGDQCMLVGDDLFVTNTVRLEQGIESDVANAILIKLNQIGTLTETISAIYLAKINDYKTIISHRSGETADTFIADLAVAVNADFIKTGSLSRSERVEKYNRLMEIEEQNQH